MSEETPQNEAQTENEELRWDLAAEFSGYPVNTLMPLKMPLKFPLLPKVPLNFQVPIVRPPPPRPAPTEISLAQVQTVEERELSLQYDTNEETITQLKLQIERNTIREKHLLNDILRKEAPDASAVEEFNSQVQAIEQGQNDIEKASQESIAWRGHANTGSNLVRAKHHLGVAKSDLSLRQANIGDSKFGLWESEMTRLKADIEGAKAESKRWMEDLQKWKDQGIDVRSYDVPIYYAPVNEVEKKTYGEEDDESSEGEVLASDYATLMQRVEKNNRTMERALKLGEIHRKMAE